MRHSYPGIRFLLNPLITRTFFCLGDLRSLSISNKLHCLHLQQKSQLSLQSLCKHSDHVKSANHRFDSLWKEESVVERVHCVIGLNGTLFLQQDGPGVQTIVSPEHCEASFFITMDQGPGDIQRYKNSGLGSQRLHRHISQFSSQLTEEEQCQLGRGSFGFRWLF